VDLSGLPDPKKEYTQRFENLSGGLNLRDLDYLLKPNESPEMKNLNWHDGVLACRDGQTLLSKSRGQVYACAEEPFHDLRGLALCRDPEHRVVDASIAERCAGARDVFPI